MAHIKAITLYQPWASAIAVGLKTIETRDWRCEYRGPIAIHAGRKWDEEEEAFASRILPEDMEFFTRTGIWKTSPMPLGGIVAIANLKECLATTAIPGDRLTARERRWGGYDEGRYGWLLTDIRPLVKPIGVRGYPGIWDWNMPEDLALAN